MIEDEVSILGLKGFMWGGVSKLFGAVVYSGYNQNQNGIVLG